MSNLVQVIVVNGCDSSDVDVMYVERQNVIDHLTNSVGIDSDDVDQLSIWLDGEGDSTSFEYPDFTVVLNKVYYTLKYDE